MSTFFDDFEMYIYMHMHIYIYRIHPQLSSHHTILEEKSMSLNTKLGFLDNSDIGGCTEDETYISADCFVRGRVENFVNVALGHTHTQTHTKKINKNSHTNNSRFFVKE